MTLLLILIAGGVGSLLRYLLTVAMMRWLAGGFPYGTLAVNVIGCLAIGALGCLFKLHPTVKHAVPEPYQLALIFGLLGGFTTFSSFGYDTLKLIQDQRFALAGTNIVVSNVLGLLAVWVGYALASKMTGG